MCEVLMRSTMNVRVHKRNQVQFNAFYIDQTAIPARQPPHKQFYVVEVRYVVNITWVIAKLCLIVLIFELQLNIILTALLRECATAHFKYILFLSLHKIEAINSQRKFPRIEHMSSIIFHRGPYFLLISIFKGPKFCETVCEQSKDCIGATYMSSDKFQYEYLGLCTIALCKTAICDQVANKWRDILMALTFPFNYQGEV